MKNVIDQATGTWATRSDASEPPRMREMPLLFQLADINRLPTAPAPTTSPSAASPVIPPGPGPLEMPPLSGTFPTAASPLAASVANSWSQVPAGLFETPSSFSTSALSVAAPPKPVEATKSDIKPSSPTVAETGSQESAKIAEFAIAQPESPAVVSVSAKTVGPAIETTAIDAIADAVADEPKTKSSSQADTSAAQLSTEVATVPPQEPAAKESTSATTDKPSPGSLRRQRSEARQQKVAGQKGDWLQTHGKVIAIGFVIALLGTIYFARRKAPGPELSPANDPPMGLAIEVPGDKDGHDHKSTEAANTAPRLVEAPALPHDGTPSPAMASPTATPASGTTADLHPPVIPAQSPAAAPAGGAPLFPWQDETRTATRPDAPLATPDAHAPANGPVLNPPTYPETNLRDAPLLPPAPPTPPAGGQGSGSTPSRSYPASFTSAPGGTRYERTGSGLY